MLLIAPKENVYNDPVESTIFIQQLLSVPFGRIPMMHLPELKGAYGH